MTYHPAPPACWRKSSYSGSGNNCVEVATLETAVAVRDSKNPDGPRLTFTRHEWRSFTANIKARHCGSGTRGERPGGH
jgi:hypothetical protein